MIPYKHIEAVRDRYPYLFEDGDANNQRSQQGDQAQAQQQSDDSAIQAARQKIVELQNQLQKKEEQFNREKALLQKQIILYNNQLIKLGANPQNTNQSEGVRYRFSRKLYESLQSSKADELAAAVKTTFDRLDTLSYYMDAKGCLAFARRILAWLNEQNWNDGQDHWEEVEDKIRMLLSGNNVSMSRREIREFSDEFKNVLSNNTVFGWIFGIKK